MKPSLSKVGYSRPIIWFVSSNLKWIFNTAVWGLWGFFVVVLPRIEISRHKTAVYTYLSLIHAVSSQAKWLNWLFFLIQDIFHKTLQTNELESNRQISGVLFLLQMNARHINILHTRAFQLLNPISGNINGRNNIRFIFVFSCQNLTTH